MNQSIAEEIRERLQKYITGELTLCQFEEWFLPRLSVIENYGSPLAERLAYDIALYWAEFTDGHWTEAELKEKLRPMASLYQASEEQNHAGTSSTVIEVDSPKVFTLALQV